jgi:hypothetical protein
MVDTDFDTNNTLAVPWIAVRLFAEGSEKHRENEMGKLTKHLNAKNSILKQDKYLKKSSSHVPIPFPTII